MTGPLGRDLLLVAAGGALGALARLGASSALPHDPSELPLATLLVNVTGCLLLGLLVAARPRRAWVRPLVATGALGGFTTFSAVALETDRLLATAPGLALGYLALTVLLGLGAARGGLALGARRSPPAADEVPV